jgi:NADH-quinone oxidoreductase subunit F
MCGLADGAAWPVKNAITKFRGEFEDYIRRHQSSAAQITPLQQAIFDGRTPSVFGTPVPGPARPLPAPDGPATRATTPA